MMKDEFEARFGCEVSPAIYKRIEQLYLDSNDINKDAFVKRCKKENTVVKIQQDIINELVESLSVMYNSIESQMQDAKATLADEQIKVQTDQFLSSMTSFGKERADVDAFRRRTQAQAVYLAGSDMEDCCKKALEPFLAEMFRLQFAAALAKK